MVGVKFSKPVCIPTPFELELSHFRAADLHAFVTGLPEVGRTLALSELLDVMSPACSPFPLPWWGGRGTGPPDGTARR